MAELDRQKALDHVVVVMFENRSFDQLLGRLYQPGEVRSFEAVVGKDLSNPIPSWAEHGADRAVVHYDSATCSRVSSGPNHSKDLKNIYNPQTIARI
jgi:phospholipase C